MHLIMNNGLSLICLLSTWMNPRVWQWPLLHSSPSALVPSRSPEVFSGGPSTLLRKTNLSLWILLLDHCCLYKEHCWEWAFLQALSHFLSMEQRLPVSTKFRPMCFWESQFVSLLGGSGAPWLHYLVTCQWQELEEHTNLWFVVIIGGR